MPISDLFFSKFPSLIKPISDDAMAFPCGMSRSGTTLLAAIIGSHSRVSVSFELIPPPLSRPERLFEMLIAINEMRGSGDDEIVNRAAEDFSEVQSVLYLVRLLRAGVSAEEAKGLIHKLYSGGCRKIKNIRPRFLFAYEAARILREKDGKEMSGFKINNPAFVQASRFFPNGKFIYIIRDPRDVLASHMEKGFPKTASEVAHAWVYNIEAFEGLMRLRPDAATVLRYEDLVSDSARALPRIFGFLGLEMEDGVYSFYEKTRSDKLLNHPSRLSVASDFFTSSIGRWRKDLDPESAGLIEGRCAGSMRRYGYVA